MDSTFKVLKTTKVETLEQEATKLISDGFEPHGTMIIQECIDKEGKAAYVFILAMKKLPKKSNSFAKKELDVIGKCPVCGEDLAYSKTGFIQCTGKDCAKSFYKYYERVLTRDEAKALFAGETIEIDKVKRNDGSFGTAKIKLGEKHEGKWFSITTA